MFKTGHRLLKDLYDNFNASEIRSSDIQQSVVLNTLPWHRKELVEISDNQVGVACGDGNLLRVRSFKTQSDDPAVTLKETKKGEFVLENDQYRVVVEGGVITSLYDRENEREVIEKGGHANKFVLFDDIPLYWEGKYLVTNNSLDISF